MPFTEHTKSPMTAELIPHIAGEELVGEQSGFNFSPGGHYNPTYIQTPYNPAYVWAQSAHPQPSVPLSPRTIRRRALVAQRGVSPAQEQAPRYFEAPYSKSHANSRLRQPVGETIKTESHVNHLSHQPVQSSLQVASGADPWPGYPALFPTQVTISSKPPQSFLPVDMQPSSDSRPQPTYTAESDSQSPQKSVASEQSPDQSLPACDWRSLGISNEPDLMIALGLWPATPDSLSLPASPSAIIRGRKPDNEQKYRTNVKNCQDELKDAVEKAPEALRPAGLRLNTKATIQSSAARLIRHLVSCCKQQARELHRLKQENQSLQQQLQGHNRPQPMRLTCNTTFKY